MPMIITFRPFLYSSNFSPVSIFNNFCQPQPLVFVPIQFFHHVHELPIFTQSIRDRPRSRNNISDHLFQHRSRPTSDILGITQIPVNKIIRNILSHHFQLVIFSFTNISPFKQLLDTLQVFLQPSFPSFA